MSRSNISGNSGVKMIDAGGCKVRATTPEAVGGTTVEGIEHGRFRILVETDAHLLDRLVRLAPKWETGLIVRQKKPVLFSSYSIDRCGGEPRRAAGVFAHYRQPALTACQPPA